MCCFVPAIFARNKQLGSAPKRCVGTIAPLSANKKRREGNDFHDKTIEGKQLKAPAIIGPMGANGTTKPLSCPRSCCFHK